MKKYLLFLASLFSVLFVSAQPYTQPIKANVKYYIGKTFKMQVLDPRRRADGYDYLVYDITKWGGNGNTPYPNAKADFYSSYDSLVNKTFKCIDAGEVMDNSQKQRFFKLSGGPGKKDMYLLLSDVHKKFPHVRCLEQDNEGLATLNVSIDSLKRLYVGKTAWATSFRLLTHDQTTGAYNALTIDDLRFAPLNIIDIKPSPSDNNPIRVIFRTNKNLIGYEDVALKKDLLKRGYYPTVNDKAPNEKIQTIDEAFYLKDPRITYNLTPAKLAAIKKRALTIGMDRDVVMLIEGKPDDIDNTSGVEQWIYDVPGGPHYLYFKSGKYSGRN